MAAQLFFRYLKEQNRMGTAGGFIFFKNEILSGNPTHFFVLHGDIMSTFPLVPMMNFHVQHSKEITIMGTKVISKNDNLTFPYRSQLKKQRNMVALQWILKPRKYCTMLKNPKHLYQTLLTAGFTCSTLRVLTPS
jgi:mannose-1-phosphate guanylyltransferase